MPNKLKLFIILLGLLFSVMMTQAQNTAILTYNETVTGELDENTYEQFYTFEGQAGDTIVIQMRATSNDPRLDSFLYLRDAEGQELAFDDDTGGNLNSIIGPYTLEEDGTYTVVATRFQQADGSSMGTYELIITLGDFEAVDLDEVKEITFDGENMISFFSFTPTLSTLYQLNYTLIAGEYGTDISVRDSQGNHIGNTLVDSNNTHSFVVMPLNADEPVHIFIRSYATYDENNILQDNPLDVSFSINTITSTPITFDDDNIVNIVGTLETLDRVDYYTFDAIRGQTIGDITQNSLDGFFEFYVLMPSRYINYYGSNYYNQASDILMPAQILTETGEYLLVVHRGTLPLEAQADEDIVNYDFNVALSPTPEIIAGVTLTGSITSDGRYAPEDNYLYNAQAGETITFTLNSTNDNFHPVFSIELPPEDPTSMEYRGFNANFHSTQPGTIRYDVTLPYDGTYIVRILNNNYNDIESQADYELMVESN